MGWAHTRVARHAGRRMSQQFAGETWSFWEANSAWGDPGQRLHCQRRGMVLRTRKCLPHSGMHSGSMRVEHTESKYMHLQLKQQSPRYVTSSIKHLLGWTTYSLLICLLSWKALTRNDSSLLLLIKSPSNLRSPLSGEPCWGKKRYNVCRFLYTSPLTLQARWLAFTWEIERNCPSVSPKT